MDLFKNLALLALVAGAGWWARRRGRLGEPAVRGLGRICVDITFPCLTFTQMLKIVGSQPAVEQALVLVIGAILMTVAFVVGWWMSRRVPAPVRSAAWLAQAMPNWIFLPLPVAAMLYGPLGVSTVLLVNVVAQFFLWTTCVGILRGFGRGVDWRALLSPGLLATAAGAALAAAWPASRGWLDAAGAWAAGLRAVAALGLVTIPLSMLVFGAQLAGGRPASRGRGLTRRIMAGRLVVAPLATLLVAWGLHQTWALPPEIWRTVILIAAMPVGISCGVLVERHGGDRDVMGDSILLSTLLSAASVPPFVLLANHLFR